MALRYRNPIWSGYFADPFVLRHDREYYAYGTAETLERSPSGGVSAFKILRSADLVHWSAAGSALKLSDADATFAYWAPEVAERDGRFFLYFSRAPSGRDELHRLHVASARSPLGPFTEATPVLPESEGFTIDAHPFRDPRDGKWYLFYARDYFDLRVGTGLAVVALGDTMRAPAAAPRPILRANADWQIYERNRALYGKTWEAWHTVEGPCVVEHDGRYYCFYSGGNWQTHEYGVSYAVADHPLGPWQHPPITGPAVLRQRPGEVLGPGHNSYTVAPDGRTELLVYHAWDVARTARRMCIDRLLWTKDGPQCAGPTTNEQSM